MALWKDSSNQIHDDMDGEAMALPSWPQGMTQISHSEADAITSAHAAAAQAALAKFPDPAGFEQAIKSAVGGILGANALAVAYPLFFGALQDQAWDDVQSMLVDASDQSAITATQYEAIKAATAQFNIPLTL